MAKLYAGMYPQFDEGRFEKLRELFHLPEKKPIRRMSKGMQRQAAFWITMSCLPEYLVLDEPVDGLDPVMRRQVWQPCCWTMCPPGAPRVLLSSHNLRELEDVCDHVGIMDKGKVLLERTLSDLQDNTVKLQVAYKTAEEPTLPTELQIPAPLSGGPGAYLYHARQQRGTLPPYADYRPRAAGGHPPDPGGNFHL